jgi:hypothetical protein
VTGLDRFNARRLPKFAARAASRTALVTAVTAALVLAAPALVATARADDAPPADPVTDTSPPPPDPTPPAEPSDTTPPDTVLNTQPAALANSASASFGFDSTESGSSFQCSLDGAPATACTSPAGFDGLADGAHSFSVAATDPAGNPDPSPASYSWTIDTTAPGAPTGLTTTSVTSSNVDLAWTASPDSDIASFQVLRDGLVIGTSTTTTYADATVAAPTTHSYTVLAVDQAGNVSPATDPLTVEVRDTNAPPGPDPGPDPDPAPDPPPAPDPAPTPAPDPGADPGVAPDPAPAPAADQPPAPPDPAAAQEPPTTPAPAALADPSPSASSASVAAVPLPVAAQPAPQPSLDGAPAGYKLVKFAARTPGAAPIGAPSRGDTPSAVSLCKVNGSANASTRAYPATLQHEPRSTTGTRSKHPKLPAPSRELPPGGGGSSPISGSFGGASGGHANGDTGIVNRVLGLHRTPVGRLLSLAEPTRRPVDIRFLLERPG